MAAFTRFEEDRMQYLYGGPLVTESQKEIARATCNTLKSFEVRTRLG